MMLCWIKSSNYVQAQLLFVFKFSLDMIVYFFLQSEFLLSIIHENKWKLFLKSKLVNREHSYSSRNW